MKPPASNWLLAPIPVPANSHSAPDHRLVPGLERVGEGDGLEAFVLDVDFEMILQVLADPRQVEDDGRIDAAQDVGRADARALKELRRGDRAGAHQHLPARPRNDRLAAAPQMIGDAARASPLEQDAVGQAHV